METNYVSKYSGELVDAAVEYFLNHSVIVQDNSYSYTRMIFCESNTTPAVPFNSLPTAMPANFPILGTDYNHWYEYPNTTSRNWYLCVLTINKGSNMITSQSSVLPMTGSNGLNGLDGLDGLDGTNGPLGPSGTNGSDGKDANYPEYRYKRSESWAISLTLILKTARVPEGWELDPSSVGIMDESELRTSCNIAFFSLISTIAGGGAAHSSLIDWLAKNYTTYSQIDDEYYSLTGHRIGVAEPLQEVILNAYNDFKEVYSNTVLTIAVRNDRYHSLYTLYINSNHQWNLFMITAIINGETEEVIGEWSSPIKLTGNDGSVGPQGDPGVAGIPGVSIGVAFTIGDELSPNSGAVSPLSSPYNKSYSALIQAGTGWIDNSSGCNVTEDYPYIWFTLCRYYITTDAKGNEVEVIEDPWSAPKRYSGLNGVTSTVLVRLPTLYPMGIYDRKTTYINNGYTAPYVAFEDNYYFLAVQATWRGEDNDPDNEGLEAYATDNNPDTIHPWVKFELFEAIFSKVAVIANGLIGSAVFNGNFVFSLRGLRNNADGSQTPSSHYEDFLVHKSSGDRLDDSLITSTDNAFVPYFWINFATGEFGATSMDTAIENGMTTTENSVREWTRGYLSLYYSSTAEVDNKINTKSSEILLTATQISLSVKDDIEGELSAAGINITSSGVEVEGKFSGTSSGSFEGDVSATSFSVVDDLGSPVMVFTTYDTKMGTLEDGNTLTVGTPIVLINFNGNLYILNMTKLSSGSPTAYSKVYATTSPLYTTDSVALSTGTLGAANYNCITKAPYLAILDNQGNATSTIQAVLYDSDGATILNWSDYLNKYYSGTLISEYSDKTNLNNGVWAFKLVGNLATTSSDVYKGIPYKYMAAHYIGKEYLSSGGAWITNRVYSYTKVSIVNGVLSGLDSILTAIDRDPETGTSTGNVTYLKSSGVYFTATNVATGETVASSYFLVSTTTPTLVTASELRQATFISSGITPSPD